MKRQSHDNFENAERYDWLYEDVDITEPHSLWSREGHGPVDREQFATSVGKRNSRRNMGDHMFVSKDLSDDDYKRTAYQRYLKKFLRRVRGVDDNIARLVSHLEEPDQLDNTLIGYTADQGFMLGEHDYIDTRWMYEESLRMPLIARYPKSIPAGGKLDFIANNVDFAPTLLEFVGIEKPDVMQGRSFMNMLQGDAAPRDWPQATYYRYWMHLAIQGFPRQPMAANCQMGRAGELPCHLRVR